VNCDELRTLMHGYADGELDLIHTLEVERHLKECSACSAALQRIQSLQQALGDGTLYQGAPAGLRERIRSSLPRTFRPRLAFAHLALRSLAVAASLAFAAIITWGIVHVGSVPSAESMIEQEVVSAHVRSLLRGEKGLFDVASTDRHTVKPWFAGRVDFSPEVKDLKEEGFSLIGGRLDYLSGRKVAAIVYTRQKHFINLFAWATGGVDEPPVVLARQGYHLAHWTQDGLTYWAVSDLNEVELLRFAGLIRK
jgi:anti-sigma factor RsiW